MDVDTGIFQIQESISVVWPYESLLSASSEFIIVCKKSWLGLCKLENEILKNDEKSLKNHIFRPKNVILERF